jgi:phage terminase small subunit
MARKTPGDDETGTTPAKGSRPSRAKRHLAVVAGTDTVKTPRAKPTTGGGVVTSKGASPTGTRRKSGKNLLLGLTSKQEAFAEAVVSGMSLSAAYRHAYDAQGMQDESVRVAASRLFSQANVSLRVQALNSEKEDQRRMLMVSDAEASINTLREMLKSADTSSAKIRAAELLGKAAGIFTDRIEVNDTTDRSTADIERSIADRLARLGLTG